jgi:hypothetical protein
VEARYPLSCFIVHKKSDNNTIACLYLVVPWNLFASSSSITAAMSKFSHAIFSHRLGVFLFALAYDRVEVTETAVAIETAGANKAAGATHTSRIATRQ